MKKYWWVLLLAVVVTVVIADPVWASETGTDDSIPWEGVFEKLRKSISGPVAFTIGLFSVIGIGTAMAFGGDMNGWLRSAIILVLASAFVVSAPSMMKVLSTDAATIAYAVSNLGTLVGIPLPLFS